MIGIDAHNLLTSKSLNVWKKKLKGVAISGFDKPSGMNFDQAVQRIQEIRGTSIFKILSPILPSKVFYLAKLLILSSEIQFGLLEYISKINIQGKVGEVS